MKQKVSEATRRVALDLAAEHGPGEASRRTGIPRPTISSWLRRANSPKQPDTRERSDAELLLTDEEIDALSSEQLRLYHHALMSLKRMRAARRLWDSARPVQGLSRAMVGATREHAVRLYWEVGPAEAGKLTGFNPSTISTWALYSGECETCGAVTTGKGPGQSAKYCHRCVGPARARWTDDKIVRAIVLWARVFGQPPAATDWAPALIRPDSPRREQAERHYRGGGWPGTTTVINVFGSWNAAIVAAGFPARRPGERGPARCPAPPMRQETKEEAAELYRHGLALAEVGKRLDVGERRIRSCLQELGVPLRRGGRQQRWSGDTRVELRDRIVAMTSEGVSCRQIANQLGICRSTVRNLLHEAGVPRQREARSRVPGPTRERVILRYGDGLSIAAVAREVGLSNSAVGKIVQEAGVSRSLREARMLELAR